MMSTKAITAAVVLIGFLLCSTVSITYAAPPNVLMIVLDDLRPSLGCYGYSHMITPNIDQLSRQSVTFTNAYAQQALCGPSRTSFLTSRRPDTTRLIDVHSYWRRSAGNYTTLPQHFKENGFHAVSVGKIFHPGIVSNKTYDFPLSWSEVPYIPPTRKYKNAPVCNESGGQGYTDIVCPVNVAKQPGGSLPDIESAEYAINYLKNRSNNTYQPFFLAVGFHKPHIPLKYPEKFKDLYPLSEIHLAPGHTLPKKLPPVAWNPWTDLRWRQDVAKLNVSFPYGPLPKHYQKLVRQSYYATISYVDDLVGRLLTTLDSTGYSSNTIVLLFGDHGWSLGEHQEWSKYSNFDVSTRVPLMLRVPGMTAPFTAHSFPYIDAFTMNENTNTFEYNEYKMSQNSRYPIKNNALITADLVELVDIFPTLAELAGIPVPPICPKRSFKIDFCSEGVSFVSVIHNLTKGKPWIKHTDTTVLRYQSALSPLSWKRAIFTQYPRPSCNPQENSDQPRLKNTTIMGYSLRTSRYRYTEWVRFNHTAFTPSWSHICGRELYLLLTDPHEDSNVADDEIYSEEIRHLSKMLHAGWRSALPPRFTKKININNTAAVL